MSSQFRAVDAGLSWIDSAVDDGCPDWEWQDNARNAISDVLRHTREAAGPDATQEVAERLKRVQIENTDAVELIEDHDHEDCLFDCDPPYPPSVRNGTGQYEHEFDADEHRRLADALHECDAHVAVSGYACELLDGLYTDWYCYSEGEKTLAGKGTGSREEVLYTNYDAEAVTD